MRSLYPNMPQMGQIFYHDMLMLLHDSMPSFMNFGRILDLLELQKQVRRSMACSLILNCAPEMARKPVLLVFWERGSPDLPACGLRRGSKGGPARPIFTNTNPRPSRGAKPRGADGRKLPQARPCQAGSRGGGEIKAGYLTRCP